METGKQEVNEQQTIASWSDVTDKPKDGKYISPEYDVSYKIVIASISLYKKPFKAGDVPKLKAACVLKTINGEPSGKIWETGSFSVMKELKKHVDKEGVWCGTNVVYLMKKKKEGDKTIYIFEELGEASP